MTSIRQNPAHLCNDNQSLYGSIFKLIRRQIITMNKSTIQVSLLTNKKFKNVNNIFTSAAKYFTICKKNFQFFFSKWLQRIKKQTKTFTTHIEKVN